MQPKKSAQTKSAVKKKASKKIGGTKTSKKQASGDNRQIISQNQNSRLNDAYYADSKKYIEFDRVDYDQEKKRVYIIAILIPVIVILAVIWFINLKKNISESADQLSFKAIQTEVENSIGQFKNNFEFNNSTNTDQQISESQIESIKEDIINKVKEGLDPSSWPIHESSLMGISVQYPTTWVQKDENKLIRLSDEPATSSSSTAEVAISLKTATKNTKLEDWLKKNFTAVNYKKVSSTEFLIPNKTTIQFNNSNTEDNQINSIIFLQNNNKIYQINIKSLDKEGNGFLIDKIIKSIKLL